MARLAEGAEHVEEYARRRQVMFETNSFQGRKVSRGTSEMN